MIVCRACGSPHPAAMRCEVYRRIQAAQIAALDRQLGHLIKPVTTTEPVVTPPVTTKVVTEPRPGKQDGTQVKQDARSGRGDALQTPARGKDRHKDREGRLAYLRAYMARRRAAAKAAKQGQAAHA